MEETEKLNYDKLCKWCGEELKQPEGTCPKCDIEDNGNKALGKGRTEIKANNEMLNIFVNRDATAPGSKKEGYDWLITLLLCFFVGFLGVHRFYTGSMLLGVGQLLTFGGCGLWTMVDFALILMNSYKDGNGRLLVKNGFSKTK
ncbi:MAG TPA: TM2 domain-containing protein [Leptospiraceae bacterium]|nr:TM2 domain-containing protein [Leptospiraceae bacterium]HRG75073.1 TM2 domain-containing protein [Leptospiraceae bacterium]